MPSTLTKDCHLPLAPGTKHKQKCKSGNPPASKPKGHKRKTHRFVFDEESAALNPSHQHLVWVPRHRISSVSLNRGKSRVRRGDSASSGGKNAMTHCRRIQYSLSSQRSRGLLVWVVWGVCCLEIFFLKAKQLLSFGPIIKMSPKWGKSREIPLPEEKAPGLGNHAYLWIPCRSLRCFLDIKAEPPQEACWDSDTTQTALFQWYLFTSQLSFDTVSQFQPIWSLGIF